MLIDSQLDKCRRVSSGLGCQEVEKTKDMIISIQHSVDILKDIIESIVMGIPDKKGDCLYVKDHFHPPCCCPQPPC